VRATHDGAAAGGRDHASMQRLALVGKLKDGACDRAAEIVRRGPPFDPGERGFDRHTVLLAGGHVIFIFEGEEAESRVRDLLSNGVGTTALAVWEPLLDGLPEPAAEGYYWRRTG
jgi:hypothetical protein